MAHAFPAAEDPQNASDMKTNPLFGYLEIVMYPAFVQETAAADFTAELLRSLSYDGHNDRVVFIQRSLLAERTRSLRMMFASWRMMKFYCFRRVYSQLQILRLVIAISFGAASDHEDQVVANAIAASTLRNYEWQMPLAIRTPRISTIFPGLIMHGTILCFYKITVTAAIGEAVQMGTYPTIETRVARYIPALPCGYRHGMQSLANRLENMRCLTKAFKITETGTFS
jgi:hypothetical protein